MSVPGFTESTVTGTTTLAVRVNVRAINSLTVNATATQIAIADLATNVKTVANQLFTGIDNVEKKVTVVNNRLDSMEEKFGNFNFNAGLRGQFLPYAHHWFDGSTGNNCICPAEITDHEGRDRELVVFSIPALERFYSEECPNKIDGITTRSFFTGRDFRRASGLNYKDCIEALLRTGFKFLSVGPGWNQERKRNMERFVFVEGDWYKKLLADICTEIPDRPLVRDFIQGGRSPNYKQDGVDFGFRQVSETNQSTGKIVQIGGRSISSSDKKKCVVQGQAWCKEWYTEFVADLFGVPSDMAGVHHVASSGLDTSSAPVMTHRNALKLYQKRNAKQVWKAEDRKRKREAKAAANKKKARRDPIF